MIKYCCDEFAKQAADLSLAGGGFLYPEGLRPSCQIEPDAVTGMWNVNGCCGGGCYVLSDLKFCPFCGKDIRVELVKDES